MGWAAAERVALRWEDRAEIPFGSGLVTRVTHCDAESGFFSQI